MISHFVSHASIWTDGQALASSENHSGCVIGISSQFWARVGQASHLVLRARQACPSETSLGRPRLSGPRHELWLSISSPTGTTSVSCKLLLASPANLVHGHKICLCFDFKSASSVIVAEYLRSGLTNTDHKQKFGFAFARLFRALYQVLQGLLRLWLLRENSTPCVWKLP